MQRDRRTYHLKLGSGGPRARWGNTRGGGPRRGGGRGGGPRARRRARWRATGARAEEGHGRARWRPHEEEEGGVHRCHGRRTDTARGRRGRRCSTRKKTSGSICARRWRLYIRENYSRCQPPTGSKGFFWRATKLQPTFTPGWASHPGVKVACSFVSRLF